MERLDPIWIASLRERLNMAPHDGNGFPVSIKIRLSSGCFCRSCCRAAWAQIDKVLPRDQYRNEQFIFEEHESGPEIIVYLAVTTAGLTLAKSVVDLITAIIKARTDGAKKGDRPYEPLQVVVRSVTVNNIYREKEVLVVSDSRPLDRKRLASEIDEAVAELFSDSQ